jgi:L-serine dehydratase
MKKQNADTWSVFDVIGPVMVGPSSSHTAGACKLGYMARIIFGYEPEKITLNLHGSFGQVYEGHYTDVALLGGLLKFLPSDKRIIDAKHLCDAKKIEVVLKPVNLGASRHPNTVEFVLEKGKHKMKISGASLGGGKVAIESIGKVPVRLNNSHSSLLVCFEKTTFSFNDFLRYGLEKGIEIDKMRTFEYKNTAILDIETKGWFGTELVKDIEDQFDVKWVRFLNHISHYTY